MSINKNKKYLAAVSGGPDSMFMLYLLKDRIAGVCHVNYQKRKTANRDMKIVKDFCVCNKIKFYCLKVNKKILNYYTKNNSNFQNAARLIRYDFFVKCANKLKINKLLVAHNKDDFLETALMQKQRHSQSLFLGIKDINIYKTLYIVRPLLECWKSQILYYCENLKIIYGIDETNMEMIYERNRIRKIIKTWTQTKKENEYKKIINFNQSHNALTEKINLSYWGWSKQGFEISYFKAMNKSILKYVIYEFLIDNNVINISSSKINNVIQFIMSNKHNINLRLGNGTYLHKQDKKLVFKFI